MKQRLSVVIGVVMVIATTSPVSALEYYVSPQGADSNLGTITSPWQSIKKGVEALRAGDTLYVRAGVYETIEDAWRFQASGTASQPITVRNYPGEQAIFKINSLRMERRAFRCGSGTAPGGSANYIKLLGTDVTPHLLSNGVTSNKGMVVLGITGANAIGIEGNAGGCHYWEIAGFDFIETGGGVFQRLGPSTYWHVHDNRVYNYYRESGMQFNGHYNTIENNEIMLVNSLPRTYGCQTINLVGHHNTVRNNYFSRGGSTHRCLGVLFEWDLADYNTITNNTFEDMSVGVGFSGGDYNQITRNVIKTTKTDAMIAFNINSYPDSMTGWPCNEQSSSLSSYLPPNQPQHSDYLIYYNPRNCHSHSNTISDNQVIGYPELVRQGPVAGVNNTMSNNTSNARVGSGNPAPSTATGTRTTKLGDLNNDDAVDIYDFNHFLRYFGSRYTIYDYNSIVSNYGK